MCGRYSDRYTWAELHALYSLSYEDALNLEPRSNIAPTQRSLVIRRDAEGKRRASMMRWGLVPFWAKDPKKLPMMVNARVETITTLASYCEPVRKRHAVAVADGYYEWTGDKKAKQPWRFVRQDGGPISFPAIWEAWTPKGEAVESWGTNPVESFSIVTAEPSPDIAHIHDRMPVLLERDDIDLWLDPDPDAFDRQMALLRPAPVGTLRFFPVSPRVNSYKNEGPDLVEPITLPAA
jgi:putative SOS response-associated peptidase YedK